MASKTETVGVVSAPEQILVSGHTGMVGNQPEDRKRLIKAALVPFEGTALTFYQPESAVANFSSAECVHDKGLLDFYEIAWKEWVEEYKKNPSYLLMAAFSDTAGKTAEQLSEEVPPFVCKFGFAPRFDGTHDVSNASVLSKIAYYSVHTFTPIHESTLGMLKWDLASDLLAANIVLEGKHRVVYSQIVHGGHHAGPSYFAGFCFLNHAAIAAKSLQKKYAKVAVVDVDYHHGNGTQAIFWDDPTVFFASIHGDPNHEYPFTTGFAHQTGGQQGAGTTLNVPLPGGTEWPHYKIALQSVIDRVKAFGAEALVVSLGEDTLKGDPMTFPQSTFALKVEDFAEMGKMLLDDLGLPTVVIQEGGYLFDQIPRGVCNFLLRRDSASQ